MSYFLRAFARLTLFALLGLPLAWAQSKGDLSKYEYAKALMSEKKYGPAIVVLQRFVDDGPSNDLYLNSVYLQGVASFRLGKVQEAREKVFQLVKQHPDWAGIEEAYFLLATIDFQNAMPEQAMKNLSKVNSEPLQKQAYHLKKQEMSEFAAVKLKALYAKYPKDEAVGRLLLASLYKEANWEHEMPLIEELEVKFNPNAQKIAKKNPLKASYNIGMLLPFKEGELTTSAKPNFVLDIYEGAKLAVQDLATEGVALNLYAFDTKKDSASTMSLLQDDELRKLDLIVGPVYPETIPVVHQFSEIYDVPMVNPLSEDAYLTTRDRPLSFSLAANSATQASFTANYAFKQLKSLTAYIVYGTKERDSVAMATYSKKFRELGGMVIDSIEFSYGEDTYKNLNRRLSSIVNTQNAHVFVASSELSVANTLISTLQAFQVKGVTILGPKRWLDLQQLGFARMESANVQFYSTLYLDEMAPSTKAFNQRYLSKYSIIPSTYSFLGYEAVYYFGKMLHKYGSDFPTKIHEEGAEDMATKGKLYGKINYVGGNDNQAMEISAFKEGIFQVIYPDPNEE